MMGILILIQTIKKFKTFINNRKYIKRIYNVVCVQFSPKANKNVGTSSTIQREKPPACDGAVKKRPLPRRSIRQ